MYINFKITIALLIFGNLGFSQTNTLFKSYLDGDYKTILASPSNSDQALLFKASAYTHMGAYQKADSIFLSINDNSTVLYLNEKGFLLLKMFQLDKSKSLFEGALIRSQKLKDKEGERLATTNLALYHFAVGNYDLQHTYAVRALLISKELYGELALITAGMYNNLALALSGKDEESKVLHLYDQAIASYNTSKEDFVRPLISRVYINKSLFYLNQKEFAEAERNALNALSYASSNNANTIFVYTTLGAIYSKKNDLSKSKEYLFKALSINNKDHVKERIELYNRLAEVLRLEKEFKLANQYLDSAISINVLDGNGSKELVNTLALDAKLSSFYERGEVYFDWYYQRSLKVKHLKAAVFAFEQAIAILDAERKILITQKDKIRIGALSKDIYDKLIKATYDLSRNTFQKSSYEDQSFRHIQQSKAAVLNESINENKALHFASVPDKIIEEERAIRSEILHLEHLLTLNKPNKDSEQSLTKLRRDYEQFISNLEQEYPRYYKLKYSKNIKEVPELMNELSDDKVIYSYYLTADQSILYVATVDQNGLTLKEVYTGEDFIGKIHAIRNHIGFKVYDGYNSLSHHLFKLLIPNAKKVNGKSVVFFPDGMLNSLPFEALSTAKSEEYSSWEEEPYLIHTVDVGYGISTALYTKYEKKKLTSYSLFAPVTFDYGTSLYLDSLPYTKNEVLSIDSIVSSTNVNVFLNEQATKTQFLNNLDVNVVHLATHGLIDQEKPELSRLCLSKSGKDAFLYNNEIYNLNVNLDLVAISACETGLGKLSKGEGVIGLTRAWVYAGSKNLLVSYWPVNDFATSKLMSSFYSFIDNSSFSSSLAKAKRSLINEKATAAPYYWAGFVLIGE